MSITFPLDEEIIPQSQSITIPDPIQKCKVCSSEFPKNDLYYAKSSLSCHECAYKAKIEGGTQPRFVSENGKSKDEWKRSTDPDVPRDKLSAKFQTSQTSATSPWKQFSQPSSSSQVHSSFSVSSPSSSSTFTSASPQIPRSTSSNFVDAIVKKTKEGVYVIIYPKGPYLTLSQNPSAVKVVKASPKPILRQPTPQASSSYNAQDPPISVNEVTGSVIETVPEEEEEEEEEEEDSRHRLYVLLDIHKVLAGRLKLDFDKVHAMNDTEVERNLNLVEALSGLSSNTSTAKQVLLFATLNVEEISSRNERVRRYVDIEGLTQEINEDPDLDGLLGEVVDKYRYELEEYLTPEVKLGFNIFKKALSVDFRNKKKRRQLECQRKMEQVEQPQV